jgi:hypothetical protein
MIISASRRTDIPAFYGEWFMNRIREGYVLVRNPINPRMISKISITPENIDAIVFWTKNPDAFMDNLDELDQKGYSYYFLFTVTPYTHRLECCIQDKTTILHTFKCLSNKIGKSKVIWRYDPIIITDELNEEYHIKNFLALAEALKGYTEKCVTSFLVGYRKCIKNIAPIKPISIDLKQKESLIIKMASIASSCQMLLSTCADVDIYDALGIYRNRCIDIEFINQISGRNIKYKKDIGQRLNCFCTDSVDIGAYDTCLHHCLYCYANADFIKVQENVLAHDVNSPLLIGKTDDNDKIKEKFGSKKIPDSKSEPMLF